MFDLFAENRKKNDIKKGAGKAPVNGCRGIISGLYCGCFALAD